MSFRLTSSLISSIACAGLIATAGALFVSQGASAAEDSEQAQRAIDTRQGALKLMGYYMYPLGGMARGRMPMDAALVARNAQHIANLAPMLTDTFRADTSKSGLDSDALPVIWEKPAEFQAKIEALIEGAADLGRIASTEGVAEGAIKGGIGKMGGACGSCHDDFRADDD